MAFYLRVEKNNLHLPRHLSTRHCKTIFTFHRVGLLNSFTLSLSFSHSLSLSLSLSLSHISLFYFSLCLSLSSTSIQEKSGQNYLFHELKKKLMLSVLSFSHDRQASFSLLNSITCCAVQKV